jgi:hypothetical protein
MFQATLKIPVKFQAWLYLYSLVLIRTTTHIHLSQMRNEILNLIYNTLQLHSKREVNIRAHYMDGESE